MNPRSVRSVWYRFYSVGFGRGFSESTPIGPETAWIDRRIQTRGHPNGDPKGESQKCRMTAISQGGPLPWMFPGMTAPSQ
jgi:hypothetical protein